LALSTLPTVKEPAYAKGADKSNIIKLAFRKVFMFTPRNR
jgi:hypothetical protein